MNNKQAESILLKVYRQRAKNYTKKEHTLLLIEVTAKIMGLTTVEFAKQVLGVSSQAIWLYQKGKLKLDDAKCDAILDAIGKYDIEKSLN